MGERQAEWCANFVVNLFPRRLGSFEKEKITSLVGEYYYAAAESAKSGKAANPNTDAQLLHASQDNAVTRQTRLVWKRSRVVLSTRKRKRQQEGASARR